MLEFENDNDCQKAVPPFLKCQLSELIRTHLNDETPNRLSRSVDRFIDEHVEIDGFKVDKKLVDCVVRAWKTEKGILTY